MNEILSKKPVKVGDLSKLFGTLKVKISGQKFKDMVRKGWETRQTRKTHPRTNTPVLHSPTT